MRKLVKRIVLYTKLDEGENKMSFRRKRDFVHDSEIRQNISKKIKNIHDDDFDKNMPNRDSSGDKTFYRK